MSPDIRIEDQETRHALEVAVEIPLWKIPKALSEHFPRLLRHIESGDRQRIGAPYARYLDIDWAAVETDGIFAQIWQLLTRKQKMQIGMQVEPDVTGADDMQLVELAGGRHVTTIHRGAYHKVGETYKKVAAWARENGVTLADSTMENYINDPTEVTTENIETLILIRVAD